MENQAKQINQTKNPNQRGVWDDWGTVGHEFRRYDQLRQADQQSILRGQTVACPVVIKDELLWGSVFRYEPSMDAETMAAVFCDYDGQSRFVPGMPVTRVLNQDGKLCRVFHRINPITFVAPNAQRTWPAWLYKVLTYSYQLDEEVFVIQTENGPGYSIRWTIPPETQVLGARENGEILFTPLGQGTLMTYNNATEPFGYRKLKTILPKRWLTKFYSWLGKIASNYYQRTVKGFVELATTLNSTKLQEDVSAMRSVLTITHKRQKAR